MSILLCYAVGVVFAWLAPPLILDRGTLHNVWNMIEWSFNTVIFLLAGRWVDRKVDWWIDGT